MENLKSFCKKNGIYILLFLVGAGIFLLINSYKTNLNNIISISNPSQKDVVNMVNNCIAYLGKPVPRLYKRYDTIITYDNDNLGYYKKDNIQMNTVNGIVTRVVIDIYGDTSKLIKWGSSFQLYFNNPLNGWKLGSLLGFNWFFKNNFKGRCDGFYQELDSVRIEIGYKNE